MIRRENLALLLFVFGTLTPAEVLAVKGGAVPAGDLEIRRPALLPPPTPSQGEGVDGLEIIRPGRGLRLFTGVPERARIDEIGRALVREEADFYRIDAGSLALRDARTFSDSMTYVHYVQTHEGLEVVDSRIGLIFQDGKLVLENATTFPGIAIATTPVIDAARAETIAREALALRNPGAFESGSELVVYPQETALGTVLHRLAFRNVLRTAEPVGRFLSIVAADGTDEILFRTNLVAYDAAQLFVEVEPRYAGQTKTAVPARGHRISGTIATDADGIFESTAGSVTVSPIGPFFNVNNAAAAERTKALSIQGGSFEQFTWTAAEGNVEELDAFYHAHTVRERQLAVTPDLAWLNQSVTVNVGVAGACNAFYDGQTINFFPQGNAGGLNCNSTARIADVIYHEYGHGIHDHLVGNAQMNDQIQEGVADYFAHTLTEDPNMGPYFQVGVVQGIRNADQNRTYPTGVQGNFAEVHESGKIWTNTWWNLRKRMIAKHGPKLGVRYTDSLHSRTLRGNPGYTTVYAQALAADDDDGNLTNGTPNSCEITAEFAAHGLVSSAQPTRGFLALTHVEPAPVALFHAEDAPVAVSVSVESKSTACGNLVAGSVTLHYRVNGGAVQTVALSGASLQGEIPGQKEGAVVEYWFSAKEDAKQTEFTAPLFAPANVYRFYVGPLTTVAKDDFESESGWTHGGDLASHDDWERGTPKGLGLDPGAAFSGTNVWGNDIGLRGGNGLYEKGTSNHLESPAIDCSECEGTRLQFRRWLTIEGNTADKARILVNGQEVWSNEAGARADLQWSFEDIDISAIADGAASIQIRFELESNATLNLGGWAIDDVAVMAVTGGAAPGEPSGTPGLSSSLNGGCQCTVASTNAPAPGSLAASLLAFAAVVVLRRRR